MKFFMQNWRRNFVIDFSRSFEELSTGKVKRYFVVTNLVDFRLPVTRLRVRRDCRSHLIWKCPTCFSRHRCDTCPTNSIPKPLSKVEFNLSPAEMPRLKLRLATFIRDYLNLDSSANQVPLNLHATRYKKNSRESKSRTRCRFTRINCTSTFAYFRLYSNGRLSFSPKGHYRFPTRDSINLLRANTKEAPLFFVRAVHERTCANEMSTRGTVAGLIV